MAALGGAFATFAKPFPFIVAGSICAECGETSVRLAHATGYTSLTSSFAELGLPEPLLAALQTAGHDTPTPIQARAIPLVLDGSDLLGVAQTGTGKTGAFTLPMLARMLTRKRGRPAPKRPRALVLSPTRELAGQIAQTLKLYAAGTRMRWAVVVGGVPQRPQQRSLERGVDVLVATPGRLLDLVGQGLCALDDVDTLVLDEADRMLDLGFQKPILEIAEHIGTERQTLLFSATMPPAVERFASQLLRAPARVEIEAPRITVDSIAQEVHFVEQPAKRRFLMELLDDPELARVILFTRTKHGAERLADHLTDADIAAEAIHGNKAQGARQRALARFRDGRARVLVATDVAARGIDIPDVTHVINFDLPNEAETYVHRIGRTGRAGRTGVALSFCAPDERAYLRAIERLTRQDLGGGEHRDGRDGRGRNRGRGAPARRQGKGHGHGGGRGRRSRSAA